jgi:beta-mannosidase
MRRVPDDSIDLGGDDWSFAYTDRRLESAWTPTDVLLRAGLTVYQAHVPGNLELDLLRNGLIDEPFQGMNIVGLRRLEGMHGYYVKTFIAPQRPGAVAELVFEGLDCIAEVRLNGTLVLESDNMLIEHRVDVTEVLRPDRDNTLCVTFRPAIEAARDARFPYPPGLVAEGAGYEGLYVRKAPHMYGWDIMPRAISMGIWRAVTLRYLPRERLERVWLDTEDLSPEHDVARLALHFALAGVDDPASCEVEIDGDCEGARFAARTRVLFDVGSLRFSCSRPRLWWPRGRGAPDRYAVRVRLLRDGTVVDEVRFEHGIRTVELHRTSVTSEAGDGDFSVSINGERLFILGTNWVPLDAYHSRDLERLPAVFELVRDIGCNAIRCWGGNVYEHDLLFELCDANGIVVWQDFAMACAIYPQDPDFQARIRAEVENVVRRLRQHPSLVLWAGDNECDQKYLWNGRRRDPNTNVLTRDVIPAVLRSEDPSRPYLPSSPYVDATAFEKGERYLPEDHLWGPRDDFNGPFYRDSLCHFASEIGYLGMPGEASLHRFLSAERIWPYTDNEEWLLHATSPFPGVDTHDYRVPLMATQIRSMFGEVPETLVEFIAASQATQAEALKSFIERFRSGKWRRTGIMWWNIADGWPQLSDALVDYYLVKKAAYEVVRRSQAPLVVVVRAAIDGRHEIVACNDTREALEVEFSIRDIDTGKVVADGQATAAPDAVTRIGSMAAPDGQAAHVIEWRSAIGAGSNHHLAGASPFDLERYLAWMRRFEEISAAPQLTQSLP